MPTEFVHLHLHTDFSLLDGACPIYEKDANRADIVKMAHEYKMPAVAITDHGVMGGAIDFYQTLKNNQIKPIIGCEMYVSPTTFNDRDKDRAFIKGHHLILLAKDFTGYRNLCELDSIAHLEGVYYKPRIDKKILAEKSEGLIGMSACLQGEIAQSILKGKVDDTKRIISEYQDILGKDNFYLEIMDHGISEQTIVNKALIQLSKELNIPLVATNDVHYMKKEHAKSHELLLCIQTNNTIDNEKRFRLSTDEFYFRSGDEMLEVFKEVPESLKNTLEVAERCNLEIPFVPEVNHYPVYEINENITEKKYLKQICLESIPDRYGFDPKSNSITDDHKKILERMEYELNVIDNSHYCSYFLVVWDFLKYAREKKIPVGPGRGSGAGSLVAYLTYITDIDPLRYQLLFERFLNPERVSPPDFDIDFCERRRSEVIDYVREKYGKDSVAQIGTYGTLKAKAVIKDAGRALGYSFDQRNMITKLMPNDPKLTLATAKENNPDLEDLIKREPWVDEIFKFSIPLEGLRRNMSIHAAGVIIGDQPLSSLVPLSRGSSGEIITQYPAAPCEDLGLLKMDFLGLRTLTIINDAIDNIKKNTGEEIDISKISLEDKKTFELLNNGDTISVFQLESSGMRELCKKFGVSKIEDIIALIAIYRPGPMQFIGDFIARKTGQVRVEYDHPKMEQILKETYGIMLYQEQIMQAVQEVAGFTLGGADILRRAIGKKKIAVMQAQKEKFVKGCAETNGISTAKAEAIWDKIDKFAGYGFNKSHSAAYAFLAYRTAYLKANYPVEFMTAVLTSEINNADKVAFVISECHNMGITISPPDVNVSYLDFTTDKNNIRFGLAAIKGVGSSASQTIIDTRQKDGKFKDLMDFAERVGGNLTSKVLECLTRTGAFDSFGYYRSQLVEIMQKVISQAQAKAKDREIGQGNLFDFLAPEESNNTIDIDVPDIPEFAKDEILNDEKTLLGFYVSGHPLGDYLKKIKTYSTHSIAEAALLPNDTGVRLGGMISELQTKTAKRSGKKFAIIKLEDIESSIECLAFPDTYENVRHLIEENKPIFISGLINAKEEDGPKKITVENIIPIEKISELHTKELHIRLKESNIKEKTLDEIKEICNKYPGKARTIFCITCSDGKNSFCGNRYKIQRNCLREPDIGN